MDRERPFGVLSLYATDDTALDGHRIALAEEVARRAASAAHNARQYAQRAALVRDLQTGLLLPDLPDVPGAQVAAFYHPAGQGLDIGGDFYDVFPRGTAAGRSSSVTSAGAAPRPPPRRPWSGTPPVRSPRSSTTRSPSSRPSTER